MKKLFLAAIASVVLLSAGCGTDGNSFSSPSSLTVTAKASSVALTWQPVDATLGYNVYRSTASGAVSLKECIAFALTTTTYVDSTATPGLTYYYQVTAFNSTGNSTPSLELSATVKGAAVTDVLMGGEMQGSPLVLSTSVQTLAGTGKSGTANGVGSGAAFGYPGGITTDGKNIYVADSVNNMIRKIVIATGVVTTVAGATASGSLDATGTAARFNNPFGITTDGKNIYVADTGNNMIRSIVISSGVVKLLAGISNPGSADGDSATARFNAPRGMTTDGDYLYVADTGNHMIRKIIINATKGTIGTVTTLAGATTSGNIDDTGTVARFNTPVGVATDGTSLYIADSKNHTLRKINPLTGAVTTIAGTGVTGATNGTGTAASFNTPTGVTTDGTSLFVTDYNNNLIRKINIISGAVTTVAGSGSSGVANGTGVAATFYQPTGITTDGANLFVSDYGSCLIREIL